MEYSPSKVWENLEAQASAFYEQEILARYDEEYRQEVFQNYMIHEKAFVQKTIEAILKAVSGTSPDARSVLVLFDVDNTLLQRRTRGVNEGKHVVRPTAESLLTLVKEIEDFTRVKIQLGLLTDRTPEGIEEVSLQDPGLKILNQYFVPENMYESRSAYDTSPPDLHKSEQLLEHARENWNNVVDIDLLERNAESYDTSRTNDVKLRILSRIKREKGDTRLTIIDDAQYPKWTDETKGVYGVSLREEGRFRL